MTTEDQAELMKVLYPEDARSQEELQLSGSSDDAPSRPNTPDDETEPTMDEMDLLIHNHNIQRFLRPHTCNRLSGPFVHHHHQDNPYHLQCDEAFADNVVFGYCNPDNAVRMETDPVENFELVDAQEDITDNSEDDILELDSVSSADSEETCMGDTDYDFMSDAMDDTAP